MAPDYAAQSFEPETWATEEAYRDWTDARWAEARAKGCTFKRIIREDFFLLSKPEGSDVTVARPIKGILFEAWIEQPRVYTPPHWMLAPA